MFLSLEWLTSIQAILLTIALLSPKPSEKWIPLTKWNPELQYYLAFISQTVFPAVEFIIIVVILTGDHMDDTNELTGPLVVACIVDAGIMFQFLVFTRASFRASYEYWAKRRDVFVQL